MPGSVYVVYVVYPRFKNSQQNLYQDQAGSRIYSTGAQILVVISCTKYEEVTMFIHCCSAWPKPIFFNTKAKDIRDKIRNSFKKSHDNNNIIHMKAKRIIAIQPANQNNGDQDRADKTNDNKGSMIIK